MNPVLISSLSSQRLQMIEELNPKKEKRLTFDFLSFNTPLPYGLEFQTSLETWTTAAYINWLASTIWHYQLHPENLSSFILRIN